METKELLTLLKQLREELRTSQMESWNRSLSMEDELFDRWDRAKFLKFGEGTSIYQNSLVIGEVKVGKNTWIGPFTILDGSGTLIIGNNCSISSGVQIYTHDTVEKRITDGRRGVIREKTVIGDSCYIGPLSVIKKGIKVGHHSVVGALSYVNKDVEPFTVVAGAPAKKIADIHITKEGKMLFKYTKLLKEDKIQKRLNEIEKKLNIIEEKIQKWGKKSD